MLIIKPNIKRIKIVTMDLEQELNRMLRSRTATHLSAIQSEIEKNHSYIAHVQLKTLRQLHDEHYQEKCWIPLNKLYNKYKDKVANDGNIQRRAEYMDRDIRILELTLKLVKQGIENNQE